MNERDNSGQGHETLMTKRLLLRPFEERDAPRFEQLVDDRQVAGNMRSVSHPFNNGAGIAWIQQHQQLEDQGQAVVRAVCVPLQSIDNHSRDGSTEAGAGKIEPAADKSSAELVGGVGLAICGEHEQAELGYWLGRNYWGQGFATEAAAAMLKLGFELLGLHRIHAHFLACNPASGRVLEKIGMRYEGRLRHHVRRWGRFEDVVLYGCVKGQNR